ncbi:MAG: chorismate-binding protein, partial [Anaerolineae bacterium]
ITIRAALIQGNTISVQAGAGLVADSVPSAEYDESMNKARALIVTIQRAEQGLM